MAAQANEVITLYAADFDESISIAISDLHPVETHWANYVLGVVSELLKDGYAVTGFKAVIGGDLPIGAGVSSSAALECATLVAVNHLFQFNLDRLQMAHIAQRAEHHFAGVKCGIMDMFASLMAKEGHAIRLDCRSLEYEQVPLRLDGYKFLLLNTHVKHSLAGSEYNTRRSQCEVGVALIQKHHPQVRSLRDVSEAMLEAYVRPENALLYARCRFVVQENARLHAACSAMVQNDLPALGQWMYASHAGLRNDYAVSCAELDYLVDAVRRLPAALGARMMGGGFGGCTLNLVEASAIDALFERLKKDYEESMHLPLSAYVVETADGAQLI